MGSAEVKILESQCCKQPQKKTSRSFHTKKRHTSETAATKPAQSSCQLPRSPSSLLKTRAHPHTTPPNNRRKTTLRSEWHTTRPRVSSHQSRKLKKSCFSLHAHIHHCGRRAHEQIAHCALESPSRNKKCTTSTMFCRSPTHS